MYTLFLLPPNGCLLKALLKEKLQDFQESVSHFRTRLEARGYPKSPIEETLSEVSFAERQSALKDTPKRQKSN